MKKLVILLILYSGYGFNQVPDYFANDPLWHCGFWNSDQWNNPPNPYSDDIAYVLYGDTTALGYNYYRISKTGFRNYTNTPGTNNETINEYHHAYLRQEGSAIYFLNTQSNSDELLINYNVQVGDTLTGYIPDNFGLLNDSIQKIDSVLVGVDYRKIFYLDSISGPVVIEGIGHQEAPGSLSGEFLIPGGSGIGFDHYIYCFYNEQTDYWSSTGNTEDCISNFFETIPEEFSIISIYPNPVSDFLNIEYNNIKDLQVIICDLSGEQVLSATGSDQISIERLQNGIYLIQFFDKQQIIFQDKLVIQK